jgi:hypothetical protein
MTGHIRKHQKLLWYFISAAVIISFVAYFNPSSRLEQAGGGGNYGSIDGRPLSRNELVAADRLARLGGYLRLGEGYDNARAKQQGFDLKQERYFNVLLQARAKDLGIEVGDAAVAAWIRLNLRDEKGPVTFQKFVETRLNPSRERFTESDFVDWVRLQVVRGHLADVVGVAGDLVTPREAALEFQRENETLAVSLVQFSTSNYLASVNLDPAALSSFYSNRLAVYRIPERRVLSYVRFEATSFTAEATADLAKIPDLTNRIEQIYTQRGAETFTDAQGQPLTKPAAIAQLQQDMVTQRALELANAKATEFANAIYRVKPMTPANLINEALNRQLKVANTEPFTDSGRPAGLEDLTTLGQEVAKLSNEKPITLPMRGTTGVVVAALTQTVPSEIPAFATIQSRVMEDYRRFKSQEAARSAGEAFAIAVTNGLAQGKAFAAIAAERQAAVVELAPFTLTAEAIPGLDPRLNANAIKSAVFQLKAGTASPFQPSADGGLVAFLKERKPVDEATLKAGLNTFLEEQRQQRKSLAFQEWAGREFQKSGLAELLKAEGAEQ